MTTKLGKGRKGQAVFAEAATARPAATPRAPRPRREARGAIAAWLWLLAVLVAAMVLVGGLTRLTDSGLSITVWDPVMGAVPPLSEADWQAAFAAYQQTVEFREQNHWMTLADFRPIFWWEWGHRFLGRVIGVVWLLGLLAFLAIRRVPQGWTGRLVLPGLLGGVQAGVGWWMVHGGLGALDVPSYRLALHLGLAFVIFALLAWQAMKIRLDPVALLQARRRRVNGPMRWSGVLLWATGAQILLGALVAGIDAGRGHVDWPLMQGAFFPEDAFLVEPLWRNFFESGGLVQFNHRMLGYLVLLLALGLAVSAGRSALVRLRARGRWAAAAVLAQVAVGIVTVVHASPVEIAIFHQAGALVVVLLVLRARFAAAYPEQQRITA